MSEIPPCAISIVRNDADFDALEQEWKTLVEDAPVSVFQTYEWLRPWWTYFGKGRELHVVLFRSGDRLVGIAPMFVEYQRFLLLRVSTRLQFLGTPISDYSDVIIRNGMESVVLRSFASYLRSTSETWDVFDLEDVNERSSVHALLPGLLRESGVSVLAYQGNVCPERVLPSSWEVLLQGVGPNLRNNLKRKYRRLREEFSVELETVGSEPAAIREGIEDFSRIHGERWRNLGFPSAFDEEDHREFHIEIAQRFAARGWLRLLFLKVDGKRVAVIFDFNYRKRIYMYQSNAHGPDEVMRYSPGMLIKGIAIEEGIKEGMEVFDFLRGDEPYKYEEWKAVNSKNWLLRGASPGRGAGIRFKIFLLEEFVRKSARRLQREYYELKRFRRSKHRSFKDILRFLSDKLLSLVKLGYEYVVRYLTQSSKKKEDNQLH